MTIRALALLSALAIAPAHATLHGFDIPGGGHEDGHGTYVNSIDFSGDVTGNVMDDSGKSLGFFRHADGTVEVYSAVSDAETHGIDMSDTMQTGYYVGTDGHNHGYMRGFGGTITVFDPRHSSGTQAISINAHGDIAGQYTDTKQGGLMLGFLRTAKGGFKTFNPGTGNTATFVTGINKDKSVVGFWFDGSSAMHGFLRTGDGTIAPVDIEGAGSGALQGTQIESINDRGDLAGFYTDGSNHRHGFLRERDGTVTTFDAAEGANTVVAAVNFNRQVAGYYVDASGVAHGFVRGRHGKIKSFDAPGAALEAGRGTFVSDININGAVSGEVYDHQFGAHGFEGTP